METQTGGIFRSLAAVYTLTGLRQEMQGACLQLGRTVKADYFIAMPIFG